MNKPIGIFDSGIGGLTVVKQLKKILPDEQLIYFGDTARIPYGTKSKKLIEQFAMEDARFLLRYDIKMLVVACNTASSLAMDVLLKNLDIPVVGVVIPGARAAVNISKNKRIGVIGTSATINSQAYNNSILQRDPEVRIYAKPCPLLVPLVEEGWLNDPVTDLTLQKYLADLIKEEIDTLILGCTHYPLLEESIRKATKNQVELIDSGKETAKVVKQALEDKNLLASPGNKKEHLFFVSDIPVKFSEIGSAFLGEPLHKIERIDYETFIGIKH
ncbi:MAG: glutamate racemase [Calditrichaceae bacterium]|nr:glutamate racemase [Calditrichaceae bacterium]MBN2709164.1 glutamate racemase [Calditrichaceae bacterium]RQV96120.1 MAG: glutamate racemase [Calditrichota bacterium]